MPRLGMCSNNLNYCGKDLMSYFAISSTFQTVFVFLGLPSSFPVPSCSPSDFVSDPQLFVSLHHRVHAARLPNFRSARLAVPTLFIKSSLLCCRIIRMSVSVTF